MKVLMLSSGKETVTSIIILIVRAFLPLIALFLIQHFVDALTGTGAGAADTSPAMFTWLILAMALTFLADDLLTYAGYYVSKRQSYLVEGHISSLIHRHASGLGLRFFEDPLFHDTLTRAAADISWRPAAMINDLILLMRGVVSFVAMGYVLRTFGIIPLAVLVLVFIPVLVIRWRNSGRLYRTRHQTTEDTRKASYFSWLLTGEKPAREVKLFDLGDYFERLFRHHFRLSREPEIKTAGKNAVPDAIASVVKVAAFAGVLVYATASYLNSKVTAGELAMYVIAFRQAMVYLRDAVTGYSGLAENSLFLKDLFRFLDLESDIAGEEMPPDRGSFRDITVENLTFTYPGATGPALRDISLRIISGEKVAVVGPNGSGKTTLVKLLCRLYEPGNGRIMLNGRNIKEIDPSGYRRLFSVVFQNFMLYYLSAAENIRLAPEASDEDSERIRDAAARTGLDELISSLPQGYDTPLGHHTEGGRELSWGEWQKIAIARALYRQAPVLILDEPSSSLDADSEYEIFSDLSKITAGRTCIFISHRLSNVREADRIIVLDGGRIAESGTHEELMSARGRYYTMFTRQKSMYR